MSADGVKGAMGICLLIGTLSVLAGLVALSGALEGMASAAFDPRTFGWLALGEGAIYLGLAYGIRRGSVVCGFTAAVLYTATTVSMLTALGPMGIMLRLAFAGVLWKGALTIYAFRAATPREPVKVTAPRKTGRAPWSRASAPRATAERPTPKRQRPSARHTPRRPTRRHRAPRSMCPNCRESFPAHQTRCSLCSVTLVEV